MRAYFIMVVGAAVLSALASVMSPEKWKKYIQLVTGIVILCCITAPLAKLGGSDFEIPQLQSSAEYDGETYNDIVIEELTARLEKDIEERMKKEYNADILAEVRIKANDNNEIEGVTQISVSGELSGDAKERLCEIYGVDTIYEK